MKPALTELFLISPAEHPRIEVVFVHGLDGDAKDTWNFGDRPSWNTWIQNVHPTARIWSLSYRVQSSQWRGGSMAIQDRAVNVLATIEGDLPGETPIIFVCHSYGGLLVKQLLHTGLSRTKKEYSHVAERVRAIVFLGTPHNGSRIADYIDSLNILLRPSDAVIELRHNAPHLRDLAGWFRNYAGNFDWKMRVFFETMNSRGTRVVDADSADPHIPDVTPIGIDADHFEMSKPPRPDVRLSQTNALIDQILKTWKPRSNIVRPYRSTIVQSEAVLSYLPQLRRYARSLAGTQQVGDSFVGAVLEVLAREPDHFREQRVKIVLYTTLTRLWNALARGVRIPDLAENPKLARVTQLPRQAFLLISAEGFSEADVAEILSVDIQRVSSLVEEAGRELAQDKKLNILIIEDEPFIAMDLEGVVESMGHALIGVARTHSDAIQLSRGTRPDLILADVQLEDGSSGLDAVNEICGESSVPVIFITSYPERFLTGLRPEPAFLIPKPFQLAFVAATISQAMFLGNSAI
jgi:CheY-like chemotaxis protein